MRPKWQENLSDEEIRVLEHEERGRPGFRSWLNPKNNFQVIETWFWSHPPFLDPEWQRSTFSGLDQKTVDLEYFGERVTYGGMPVYGHEFSRTRHIAEKRMEANPDFPIFRGWDFGGNHAVVTAQWINGRLFVLDEFANLGYDTRRISKEIMASCGLLYPNSRAYREFIDPSGMWDNSKASTGIACGQILRDELQLNVTAGKQEVSLRIDSIMRLLVQTKQGEPCFVVNPDCHFLIQALERAYHFPEKAAKNARTNVPEKNHPYSDLIDALQYICTMLVNTGQAVDAGSLLNEIGEGTGYKFE